MGIRQVMGTWWVTRTRTRRYLYLWPMWVTHTCDLCGLPIPMLLPIPTLCSLPMGSDPTIMDGGCSVPWPFASLHNFRQASKFRWTDRWIDIWILQSWNFLVQMGSGIWQFGTIFSIHSHWNTDLDLVACHRLDINVNRMETKQIDTVHDTGFKNSRDVNQHAKSTKKATLN